MKPTQVFVPCILLTAASIACAPSARSTDPAGEDSSESAITAAAVEIVGALDYGETSEPVWYDATESRYIGFTFSGNAGDAVVIDVRAYHEDAFVWLLDDRGHVVASDTGHGAPDTHVGHIGTTLDRTGTYTIAVREAHFESASFQVGLNGSNACVKKTCASVGASCGAIDDGCGGSLACGDCSAPDTCGGGGEANVCGHPAPPPPPPPPCTWPRQFQQTYGQQWNSADAAFVTADGAVHRGMASLNLAASKNQVPDIVVTNGSSSRVTEIRLYGTGTDNVLATRPGAYIYGLGDAMWHQVNGYAPADFVETTLVRIFTEAQRSYAELTDAFDQLTVLGEPLVPAADLADYRTASRQLMAKVRSGQLSFKLGTGHAIDFPATRQYVNGKTFSYQFSDAFGLDPKIGMQREGAWTYWPSLPEPAKCE